MLRDVPKVYGADHELQIWPGDFLYVHVVCHSVYLHYQHSKAMQWLATRKTWVWDCTPGHEWVFSGYSGILPQSKEKLRLSGYPKLSVGVIPCEERATYPECTPSSPVFSWDQIQPHRDPEKDKQFRIIDGWMDEWRPKTPQRTLFKRKDNLCSWCTCKRVYDALSEKNLGRILWHEKRARAEIHEVPRNVVLVQLASWMKF